MQRQNASAFNRKLNVTESRQMKKKREPKKHVNESVLFSVFLRSV